MRVDINWTDHRRHMVYLDGQAVYRALAADDSEGWVDIEQTPAESAGIFGFPPVLRVRGKVEIREVRR